MSKDFPPAKDGDSENLEWLRSTGEALWAKGEHTDALTWLERAAKDAESEGKPERAAELRAAGKALAAPTPPKRGMGATTLVSDRSAVLAAQLDAKLGGAAKPGDSAQADEPMDTRKFDYPDGVDPRAIASAMVPEKAKLPDDVMPAIRVWITKDGAVLPADGARPSGVLDAVLLAVVPGVDLRAALKRG